MNVVEQSLEGPLFAEGCVSCFLQLLESGMDSLLCGEWDCIDLDSILVASYVSGFEADHVNPDFLSSASGNVLVTLLPRFLATLSCQEGQELVTTYCMQS